MKSLDESLGAVAQNPVLLIACDYDGTLAELVDNPSEAHPHREALVALSSLVLMPQTHVAVISGRQLSDLARLTGAPRGVHLVGSHGSEFDPGFAEQLDVEAQRSLAATVDELREICDESLGFLLEVKPAGVAFHYRQASEQHSKERCEQVLEVGRRHPELRLRTGKKVIEFSVVEEDKGTALQLLRQRLGASAAIFLGDDVTDEDAFQTLSGPDLGIKVGEGPSAASHRVEGPLDVARVLARLAKQRQSWLSGSEAVPIESLSLLSDQRSVALVGPRASIAWYCAPRIDSPPLFAELLGGDTAGFFRVHPLEETGNADNPSADNQGDFNISLCEEAPRQRYVEDALVLESGWGNMRVVDYLDCSGERTRRRAGRSDLVRVLEGSGRALIEFAPRLDFGRRETRLVSRNGGLEIQGTPDPIVLLSPSVNWEIQNDGRHDTARAVVQLDPKEPCTLELRYGTARTSGINGFEMSEPERRLATLSHWGRWLSNLELPKRYGDVVRRSALVLKALHYAPTGAFAAAATTSLPEFLGGVRNWDYRFCWLRDGALSADALLRLGSTTEALQFLDWVLGVVEKCSSPEGLRPLYTVTGHEVWSEAEVAELAGYAGSRPVRVGNGAAQQVQLDVFGPIVDLVHKLLLVGAPVSSEHWRLVEALVEAVQNRWQEPDHGIWEIRKPQRHHVHSKVMCWLTVDRALSIAPHFETNERSSWRELEQAIAKDILEHGYKADLETFTAAYEGIDLDAAALFVGNTGLLDAEDPRFQKTVQAIEKHLRKDAVVYRYRDDDGLPGEEGGFHFCTSWLVEAYLRTGRHKDAHELFEAQLDLAGPTGLFSEEYCPLLKRALGNHPQAYSHIGLIQNACDLG